jgi:hypothetical protein
LGRAGRGAVGKVWYQKAADEMETEAFLATTEQLQKKKR